MKHYISLLLSMLLSFNAYSQELSADSLLTKARSAAFGQKDYPTAINLTRQVLEKSPDYTDAAVFLGRLYTWSSDVPSARAVFAGLERKGVQDEDFFLAYGSLEYWNGENARAIEILDKGLTYHPSSQTLLLLKTKGHADSGNYADAEKTVNKILSEDSQNTEAQELAVKIYDLSAKNAVGVTYGFSHFNRQFDDNWHLLGISYKRVTPIGSVILKGNYANKFNQSGTQFEIEAYPKLSKTFYLYVGAGYSNDVGIFPKYRTGISLNANLPESFEAEIGYRQLYFTNNIWLYTASVGKYYKNFWFNARTYISPDENNISHSYTGTVRYYTQGAADYIAFQIGTGISPEESLNSLFATESFKLKTFKIGAEYNFSIKKTNLFSVAGMYFNQEFRPNTKGNQFDITLGYTKKF